MHRQTSALAVVLSAWPAIAISQVHRGGEFQVNSYVTGDQISPAIAAAPDGTFLVAWTDTHEGSITGIFARRFDAAGNPLGGGFQVNTYTFDEQRYPSAAADPSGNVMVVWQSPQDAGTLGIYARRYDAAGTPTGPTEFRVNATTTGHQFLPKVAAAGNGSFVVAWSDDQDGSQDGVSARRYDAFGIPGPEFRVNTYTTGSQRRPAVAADAAGNFVIVWSSSQNQDGEDHGVFGQRYDAKGARVGGEFQVNSYTTGSQYMPSVAMAANGRFMVAWETYHQDGSSQGIAARRFDAAGVPQGGDEIVDTFTTGEQLRPAVAADARGDFVVTWDSDSEDGSGLGMFGRLYDASGSVDPPFQLNTYVTGYQGRGAVGAASNGDFVVAWQSYGQDGNFHGVFGQRFSPDLIFRDGFESGTLAAWSASATDGGDLSPSAFTALDFSSVGLKGLVNDTNSLFVEDDLPHDEGRYRARFYFDPNDFDPGEAQGHLRTRIFIAFEEAPTRRLAAVVLRRQAGAYSVMGRCRLDDNTQADTGFFPISAGPHALEIDWRRSTGPGANDGRFEMFIDGVSTMSVLSNLDNSVSAVDFARLGALSLKTGASGTLFWDEFESRREGYVGP